MNPKGFWGVEVRSFLGDSVLCSIREVPINTLSARGRELANMGPAGEGCS